MSESGVHNIDFKGSLVREGKVCGTKSVVINSTKGKNLTRYTIHLWKHVSYDDDDDLIRDCGVK